MNLMIFYFLFLILLEFVSYQLLFGLIVAGYTTVSPLCNWNISVLPPTFI